MLTPRRTARFDAYCTYHRLATLSVADNAPDVVSYGYDPSSPRATGQAGDPAPAQGEREYPGAGPKIYNDTAWYAGAVLLIGDLVNRRSRVKPSLTEAVMRGRLSPGRLLSD